MLATFNNAVALISGVFLLFLNGFLVGYVGVKSVMSFVGILVGASVSCVACGRASTVSSASRPRSRRRHAYQARPDGSPSRDDPSGAHPCTGGHPASYLAHLRLVRVEITQAGNAKTTNDESNNKDRMQVDVASDVLFARW